MVVVKYSNQILRESQCTELLCEIIFSHILTINAPISSLLSHLPSLSSLCLFRLASTVNTAGSQWWTFESGCSISPSTATSSSALTVATWTIILLNLSPLTKYSRLIDKCCSCMLVKLLFFSSLFLTRFNFGGALRLFYVFMFSLLRFLLYV